MDAKLKANWLAVTGIILGLVVLIDLVEVFLPPDWLSTDLMLGIVLLGFAGIFIWTYYHRVAPMPPKPADRPSALAMRREQ